jgi:hypothetical protein
MPRRLRPRLSYANVVASLALFVSLGGGAYAVTQIDPNSVGTIHLKKNAVKRKKIAPDAIKGPKVAPSSLGGSDIGPNALTGADVKESTLGQVPEAAHADRATDSDLLNDHTFGYFEAASRTEFGSASRTSATRDKILEWTNAHAMVVTDGDADANAQVRVRNTNALGDGDLLVIESDGNPVVITEGNDSTQLSKGNLGELRFVIARPDGRTAWVRCAFPAFPGAPVRCLGERSEP